MNNTPEPQKSHSPARPPSARVTAALAAVMLVVGGVLGAAVGPGPSSSLAGVPIQRLLPTIAALAGASRGSGSQPQTITPPPVSPTPTPAAAETAHRRRRKRHRTGAGAATSGSQAESVPASTPTGPTTGTETATGTGTGKTKTSLPQTSKVWLIELTGSSFTQAASQAAAAPYIDTKAVHEGTLLSSWSALDAGTFAGDAALIAGSSPQLLDTIVQPPCPEATTGAGTSTGTDTSTGTGTGTGTSTTSGTDCAAGTPGALSAADEFLKATLPTITSTSSYRENGLVVITFASTATATATGLPAGATTATLTSQPPAGALLISPFVAANATSRATFNPTSPKQSLEQLLRR